MRDRLDRGEGRGARRVTAANALSAQEVIRKTPTRQLSAPRTIVNVASFSKRRHWPSLIGVLRGELMKNGPHSRVRLRLMVWRQDFVFRVPHGGQGALNVCHGLWWSTLYT